MTTNSEHRRRETDRVDKVCIKYQLDTANKRIAELELIIDELCANAEPVCDSLEMGQDLKSDKTLSSFRKALDAAWNTLPPKLNQDE